VVELLKNGIDSSTISDHSPYLNQLYRDVQPTSGHNESFSPLTIHQPTATKESYELAPHAEEIEESLSLVDKESDLIKRALKKYKGKRKLAAQELGISERTLYRKIKDLNLS